MALPQRLRSPHWKTCFVTLILVQYAQSRTLSGCAFCINQQARPTTATVSSLTPPLPVTQGRHRTQRDLSRRLRPLNLFALNLGNGGKNAKKKDKGDNDKKDDDFPSWMKALQQWPLHPSTTDDSTEPDSFSEETKSTAASAGTRPLRSSFLSPLARRIDVEALLRAGEQEGSPASDIWSALTEASSLGEYKYNASFVPLDDTLGDFLENDDTAATAKTQDTALQRLEALNGWDQWIGSLRKNVFDMAAQAADRTVIPKSAEAILKLATARIESLVADASAVVSPMAIQTLIVKASQALQSTAAANDLVEVAKKMALDRGLDVGEAAEVAKETTAYAAKLVAVADRVMRRGYVEGDVLSSKQEPTVMDKVPVIAGSRALFANFNTATEVNTFGPALAKAAEMSALAGAIYEETFVARTVGLGHTIVARGMTEDVIWMVTDSIANATAFQDRDMKKYSKGQLFVRTITIRGFDASDDEVDRERLLNRICDATPEQFKASNGNVIVHSGLMGIAREIYKDVKQYVEWIAPNHRLILNGHSIGGSLSQLLLILLANERGVEFVRKKVLRAYTFGCPPVMTLKKKLKTLQPDTFDRCDVLDAFDLPSSLVHGYVQPWDPIVRLFSQIDALYPLVGDIGQDGVTPFASGPPRTLRPITKAIIEAWDGWPRFRDTFRDTLALQNYTNVGIQYVLLPEPTRYLGDRFVSVNIAVPPVETVLRISPAELHPALGEIFPLDVFEISFVPQAIRSFVHHFYPAYGVPLVSYAKRLEQLAEGLPVEPPEELESVMVPMNGVKANTGSSWDLASQWLQIKERQNGL